MEKKALLEEVRHILLEQKIDGWLIYDFHHLNDLAHRFLKIEGKMMSRRFFYFIPKDNKEPIKIVHQIESNTLDSWPGKTLIYNSWKTLHHLLAQALLGHHKIAMEYSPMCSIPYVSKVDGGTIDLIRSFGKEVVSSAGFFHHFTSVLDDYQIQTHLKAAKFINHLLLDLFSWISDSIKRGNKITEYLVQKRILNEFLQNGYITEGSPICAVNQNSANPHFSPSEKDSLELKRGDFVLIDLWCKTNEPRSVFADITRVAHIEEEPTALQKEVFDAVYLAQQKAIELVQERFKKGKPIYGFEVDRAARTVIEQKGYLEFFTHRTGHSIDTVLHGSGTCMDDFEMHDDREILRKTCFSIEPGIYLPNQFGVRLETDLLITKEGDVKISGETQESIIPLLIHPF